MIAYLSGYDSKRGDDTPATYQYYAKDAAKRACIGREPSAVFECVNEHAEAASQAAHDEQDLRAQERAADSAIIGAFVAFITLCVSIVGVIYVKRTLDATLEAVEDTGRATAEMIKANDLAEQTHIAEVRPWISIRDVEATTMRWMENTDMIHFTLKCVVENVGVNPAVTMMASMQISSDEAFPNPPDARIFFDPLFYSAPYFGAIIYRGGEDVVERGFVVPMAKYYNLLIAVSYRMPGRDKVFFTGRIYQVVGRNSRKGILLSLDPENHGYGTTEVLAAEHGDILV